MNDPSIYVYTRTIPLAKHNVATLAVSTTHNIVFMNNEYYSDAVSARCLQTGRECYRLEGHRHYIASLCLSVDGRTLFSGSRDRTIKEWDLDTRQCRRTFQCHGVVHVLMLPSDNSHTLWSGSWGTIFKQWDLTTGQALRILMPAIDHTIFYTIALSPTVCTLYHLDTSKKAIVALNLHTARSGRIFSGHEDTILTLCVSIDHRMLFTGAYDGTMKQWDLKTGRCVCTFTDHTVGMLRALSLSHDQSTLCAAAHDGTLKLWSRVNAADLSHLSGGELPVVLTTLVMYYVLD